MTDLNNKKQHIIHNSEIAKANIEKSVHKVLLKPERNTSLSPREMY